MQALLLLFFYSPLGYSRAIERCSQRGLSYISMQVKAAPYLICGQLYEWNIVRRAP